MSKAPTPVSNDPAPAAAVPWYPPIAWDRVGVVGFRLATLGLRFGLTFYIISMLGLEAAGSFGLILGAAAIAPAAVGLGLSYYLARDVAGQTPAIAAAMVAQRWKATLLVMALATIVAVGLAMVFAVPITRVVLLAGMILWLEVIGLDLFLVLISLEFTLAANVIVFIRTAAWIPVVVTLSIFVPEARSLDAVLGAWLGGHLASLVYLAFVVRKWPLATGGERRAQKGWVHRHLGRSWFIYISDLSIVGAVFLDRFILNSMAGLAITGIFAFYWALANAAQTLVVTAVVQPAFPGLLRHFRAGNLTAWWREVERTMLRAVASAVLAGGAIAAATGAIIWLSPAGRFPVAIGLFALLLAAAALRACAELLNYALISAGHDRSYAAINVVGVVMAAVLTYLGLRSFGLVGVGLAVAFNALLLVAIRFVRLRAIRADAR